MVLVGTGSSRGPYSPGLLTPLSSEGGGESDGPRVYVPHLPTRLVGMIIDTEKEKREDSFKERTLN